MEANEAIKKIKIALGLQMPDEDPETPQEFKEAKLADGVTIVTWEGELLGSSLMVISEEGKVPAPDGQHTLESGEVVTVSDGKVSNVEPAKEEKEEEKEIEIEMEDQYDLKAVHEMVKECMAKISALETKIAEGKIEEKVDEAMSAISTQKEAFSQLLDVVDRLAKMPSDEPAEKPDLFSSMKVNQEEVNERANALVESLKNLKSK